MDVAAMLAMWPGPFEQLFVFPPPLEALYEIWLLSAQRFDEKKFENVDGRTRDGRWSLTIL